jgi:ribosomal protein S27E
MSPTASKVTRHCPCGQVLAVQSGTEIRIKYKASWVVVRGGSVDVRCRRCGHVASITGNDGSSVGA